MVWLWYNSLSLNIHTNHTMSSRKQSKSSPYPDFEAVGTATVGERGQVVIPSAIRSRTKVKAGDHLVMFVHPAGPVIMMPVKYLKGFMKNVVKRIIKL